MATTRKPIHVLFHAEEKIREYEEALQEEISIKPRKVTWRGNDAPGPGRPRRPKTSARERQVLHEIVKIPEKARDYIENNKKHRISNRTKYSEIVRRFQDVGIVGMLPHEFLLAISRGIPIRIGNRNVLPTLEQRIDCAKSAAPYFAPKLSTVEVLQRMSDDELDRIIEGTATQAGFSFSPSRESTSSEIVIDGAREETEGSETDHVESQFLTGDRWPSV